MALLKLYLTRVESIHLFQSSAQLQLQDKRYCSRASNPRSLYAILEIAINIISNNQKKNTLNFLAYVLHLFRSFSTYFSASSYISYKNQQLKCMQKSIHPASFCINAVLGFMRNCSVTGLNCYYYLLIYTKCEKRRMTLTAYILE